MIVTPSTVLIPVDAANSTPAIPAQLTGVEKVMTPSEYDSAEDVILRILNKNLAKIESGKKNHEYRAYLLREEVKRIWFWSDDDQVIEFVVTIGAAKRPGEVNDPKGDGNDDFDAGRKVAVKYGYPITAVYRLPLLLTRETLLDEYGVDMEDKRQYVKKALVEAFPIDALTRIIPKPE